MAARQDFKSNALIVGPASNPQHIIYLFIEGGPMARPRMHILQNVPTPIMYDPSQ
jgi:hypothetical protein